MIPNIETKVDISSDKKSARIIIASVRGKYETRITGEENLWMIKRKQLPGNAEVVYVNNTDGTIGDIRVDYK